MDAVLVDVVQPDFATDQHQDERPAVVRDVRESALKDARQSAWIVALFRPSISRDVGDVRRDRDVVCGDCIADNHVLLDEAGSRRHESPTEAGIDRERDLVPIHL